MRVVLLAVVAFVLPGCLGGDELPLAKPTDKPHGPLVPASPSPAGVPRDANLDDPGYLVETAWAAGDGWDYFSNLSRYRLVRVLDVQQVGGRPVYTVEEISGNSGQPPLSRVRFSVDGHEWVIRNGSDAYSRYEFSPGAPLRFLRNGSFSFEERVLSPEGQLLQSTRVVTNSYYAIKRAVTLGPAFGNMEVGKVEHRSSRIAGGEVQSVMVTHYFNATIGNDAMYETGTLNPKTNQLENLETYRIAAARVQGREWGVLQDP